MTIKLMVMGWLTYLADKYNVLDGLLVYMSFVDLILTESLQIDAVGNVNTLKALRLLRVLRVLRVAKLVR